MARLWTRAIGALEYARMFSDAKSVREFRRLFNAPRGGISQVEVSKFRLRALDGNYVYCRTAGTDINVFSDTFRGRYHVPPRDLRHIRKILDLGSNIGLTMAHFACLFREARILGIELDAQNVEICRRNIAPYSGRCQVIWGAAWNEPGELTYGGEEEWGFRVTPGQPSNRVVRAYTMRALIDQLGAPVDFVKMDVEGAERELLKEPESWIGDIRCMKVEVHEPYTVKQCIDDFQKHRWRTVIDDHHPACVLARNPNLNSVLAKGYEHHRVVT